MRRIAVCVTLLFVLGCDGPDPWEGSIDSFEDDGSRETAKEQTVCSTPPYHTFSPDGDEDWIRFRVTDVDMDITNETGPMYEMYMTGLVGASSMELVGPGGVVMTGSAWIGGGFEEPGIYYLRVREVNSEGGEYYPAIFLWKFKQDDSDLAAADLIAAGVSLPSEVTLGSSTTATVRIGNIGDRMVGSTFDITLYASTDRILDSSSDIVIGSVDVSGINYVTLATQNVGADFSVAGLNAGPIYVIAQVDSNQIVTESENTPGPIDATNNVCVGSTLILPAVGDASDTSEPNDELTDLPPVLSDGVLADRTFHEAGDVDLYRIDADITLRYEIWTDQLRGTADTKIEILNADLTTVIAEDEDGGSENFASYVTLIFADDADPYYVRVTNEREASGGYNLNVRTGSSESAFWDSLEPDEFHPSETVRPWESLGTAPINRSLVTLDDVDWLVYAVSVANGGKTHILKTTDVSTGCATKLTLYGSKGNLVGSVDPDPLNGQCEMTRIMQPGLYYILIESDSGATDPGTYTILAEEPY